MKWTVTTAGCIESAVKLHKTEAPEYRAEIEAYKGIHQTVCEWCVWYPGGGQDWGICYGLRTAKQEVDRAIAARRFVEDARKERVK